MQEQVGVSATRVNLELLGAAAAGLLLFSFVVVVVFGSLTGVLLLIAAWALEPRRRWREWRMPTSENSGLPRA